MSVNINLCERGGEALIFFESIYEVLECYGNFVLRKKFENKQGVFPCKTAHIKKKKNLKKRSPPSGPHLQTCTSRPRS